MATLFELIKWIYFFMSLLVWIFFLRWSYIFPASVFKTIGYLLMPFYLILSWLIVWYIIASILKINVASWDQDQLNKIYIRSFLIWIIIWCIASLVYIYVL